MLESPSTNRYFLFFCPKIKKGGFELKIFLHKKLKGDFVMENGFDFEMYETIFKNCFISCSSYKNGNLQLSLYGLDPNVKQISHFADITLEQNSVELQENEIVVNNRFRPTLVPQLEDLGILKEKIGVCIINDTFYPIYTIDYSNVMENCYYLQELVAA